MTTVNSSSSSPSACPDKAAVKPARYCLCAPTTHPGSFRCRLHRPKAENALTPPSEPDQAAKEAAAAKKKEEAAAAAAAQALLARVARTSRKNGGRVKGFEPAPSRLRIMDGR